jgi:large subunit ribosomal protein L2
MAIKNYKPYTPSRRYMGGYDFSDISKSRPEKSLTVSLGRKGGRNNRGRITSRFRGGGHKRLYRLVDFKGYDKLDIVAKVAEIQYDPYRTARIALLHYIDGEKRYVLAWKGAKPGQQVVNGENAPIQSGNRKQLKDIPEGVNVYNIEFTPFTKGKIVK